MRPDIHAHDICARTRVYVRVVQRPVGRRSSGKKPRGEGLKILAEAGARERVRATAEGKSSRGCSEREKERKGTEASEKEKMKEKKQKKNERKKKGRGGEGGDRDISEFRGEFTSGRHAGRR